MSTTDSIYFQRASLRLRYIAAVKTALDDKRIDNAERTWLRSIVRRPVEGDPDPVRIDRLTVNPGPLQPFELAASLLLSHEGGGDPKVFLFSLERGIEAFKDRQLLNDSLRTRFAGNGGSDMVFQAEKVEDDPFKAQMYRIVDQQVEQLGQLTDQLRLTPTLYDAASDSARHQLGERFPDVEIDPEVRLLQIVNDSNSSDDPLPSTMTLAQSAFDDCRNIRLAEGYRRRFLDISGALANTTDSALFAQALTDASEAVGARYAELLREFWDGKWGGNFPRLELAIDAFSASVRGALYRLEHDHGMELETAQALSSLLQSSPSDSPTWRCSQMLLKVGPSPHLPLAGTFVVEPADDSDQRVWWLSPEHEWKDFPDREELFVYLETIDARKLLTPALALQDQSVLLNDGNWDLKLEEIRSSVAADRVKSIIAMQARNLLYAMGLPCLPDETMAMIDDALDIRSLLDPRQSQFSAGRWQRERSFDFTKVWGRPDTQATSPVGLQGSAGGDSAQEHRDLPLYSAAAQMPDTTWIDYAQAFDDRAEELRALDTVLFDYGEQVLQQYISVLAGHPVRVGEIELKWLESSPMASADVQISEVLASGTQRLVSSKLLSLLFECVSGHRSGIPRTSAHVVVDQAVIAGHVEVELIEYMFARIVPGFIKGYVQRFEAAQDQYQRQGKLNLHPRREALSLRAEALRLDLALASQRGKIGSAAIDMAAQVLERPLLSLRNALGAPVIEACLMSVRYGDNGKVTLADVLVLRQLLEPNGSVMLWQGANGWRAFSSIIELQDRLNDELHGSRARSWLNLLGTGHRDLLRAHLLKSSSNRVTIDLEEIKGNAFNALQQYGLTCRREDLQQICLRARTNRLEAGLFSRLVNQAEHDLLLLHLLDGLSMRIETAVFEAAMPRWIKKASAPDIKRYYDILTRYYLGAEGGPGFLFNVPSLQAYTRQRLEEQLSKDVPSEEVDVAKITVTVKQQFPGFSATGEPSWYSAAVIPNSESLVSYAINRFVDIQVSAVSVKSPQPKVQEFLTVDNLRRLVRELDVGTGYAAMLHKVCSPEDPNYVTRKRLFTQQLGPSQLALALPEKVKGTITARGYDFISNIFESGDQPREPVDGVEVILSPLQLVAAKGYSPDLVQGVYLIYPNAPETGPVLLYAIHNPDVTFREYKDQAALLNAIRTDRWVQHMLLARMDPKVRGRYANGGFEKPHLGNLEVLRDIVDAQIHVPDPVTLKLEKQTGNILEYLFDGTIQLLVALGTYNSTTNEQFDRAGRAQLFSLLAPLAIPLLPKSLGLMVVFWQSRSLLSAAWAALMRRNAGEALGEFVAAFGVLAGLKEKTLEDEPATTKSPSAIEESQRADNEVSGAGFGFSWSDYSLTPQLRDRLRPLEAKNVAVGQMNHNDLLNLYEGTDKKSYAVVAGKVYQVQKLDEPGTLFIVGPGGEAGPKLKLDRTQRWQLDMGGLKGGGAASRKFYTSRALTQAQGTLIIEAEGMANIRLNYAQRAIDIEAAHRQAQEYLTNCLENLRADQPDALRNQARTIVGDFFGIADADETLMAQIESAATSLLDALMEPSLSPVSTNSNRIVVGTNRSGIDRTVAFTMTADPERRIFLTDRFFLTQRYRLTPAAGASPFDQSLHYRAGTLIHELSHLVLDTRDIAYVDGCAPYLDQLLPAERATVEGLHDNLNNRTNRVALFTDQENHPHRDLRRDDGRGVGAILQITGKNTLDEARSVFFADAAKRSQIMLKNADSVTLLILRLGRRRLAAPQP
jgi:hypothetical protein